MKRIYGIAALLAAACFFLLPVNAAQTLTRSTGELVCAYTALAIGEGGNAVVTCAGTVVVTPPPPPIDTGPNPFVAWKAEGLTLYDIIRFRLGHGLSAAEWDQAAAAGYPRENALQRGEAYDYRGFDLSPPRGNGLFVRNELAGGVEYLFTWTAPKSVPAYWEFFEGTQRAGTATKFLWVDGQKMNFPTYMTFPFNAVAGQTYTIRLKLDATTIVGVDVRYGQ